MKTIESQDVVQDELTNVASQGIRIRWMLRQDFKQILKIEADNFERRWSESDFQNCVLGRNRAGLVAERNGEIQGFVVYENLKRNIVVLNLGVSKASRRDGIGTRLVQKLIGKLKNKRRTKISATVQESNLTAQLFFRELGFRAVSILRNYYSDSSDDAYLMRYQNPSPRGSNKFFGCAIVQKKNEA